MKIEIPNFEEQVKVISVQAANEVIGQFKNELAIKEWMSINEACEYIGISFNTFSKFRAMKLPVAEIDGIKRVSKKAIDSFLEKHSY